MTFKVRAYIVSVYCDKILLFTSYMSIKKIKWLCEFFNNFSNHIFQIDIKYKDYNY